MAITDMEQDITIALQQSLKRRISTIADEEFNSAVSSIHKRIRDEVDKVALAFLDFYSIEKNQHEIRITVKKQ